VPGKGEVVRNNVRRLRFDAAEMTQEQLGKLAGVTRHTIMAIEAGKYDPSLLLAFRIARAFGKGVEDVFIFEGEQLPYLSDNQTPSTSPVS
jgi:putative transcriptional regulator